MLVLSRNVNEDVIMTDGEVEIVVRIIEVRGDKVRLGFIAPDAIQIARKEVYAGRGPRPSATDGR